MVSAFLILSMSMQELSIVYFTFMDESARFENVGALSDPIFRYSLNFMVRALLSSSSSIFISGESAYISARKTPTSRTACNTVIRWSMTFLSSSNNSYASLSTPCIAFNVTSDIIPEYANTWFNLSLLVFHSE